MIEKDNITEAEDLALEGTEGDAVVGGHVLLDSGTELREYNYETEYARLQSQGFVEESCTTNGALMVNQQTGQKRLLKF
jgi:hypothetical protein